jgi:ribosomal protein S18 acetylase RimI-like enzyme
MPSATLPPLPDIRWHTGDRAPLRDLFVLADDSPRQLAAYMDAGRVLVAVEAERVVGHLQLIAGGADDEIELKSLAVAEDRQGRGIGRALVARAIAECRADGARTLLVSTATADIGTLRFYQRLGFRMLRVERDAFTPSEGYPDGLLVDGIPLRDRIWFSLAL